MCLKIDNGEAFDLEWALKASKAPDTMCPRHMVKERATVEGKGKLVKAKHFTPRHACKNGFQTFA